MIEQKMLHPKRNIFQNGMKNCTPKNVYFMRNRNYYTQKYMFFDYCQDEVEEIGNGKECGLKVADESINFESGDQIICYNIRLQRDKTSWDPGF